MGEPGNYNGRAEGGVGVVFPPKEREARVGIYTTGATWVRRAHRSLALLATSYGWRYTFNFYWRFRLDVVVPWLGLSPASNIRALRIKTRTDRRRRGPETSAAGAVADTSKESEAKRWAGLLRAAKPGYCY